jgi:hypothetical protein
MLWSDLVRELETLSTHKTVGNVNKISLLTRCKVLEQYWQVQALKENMLSAANRASSASRMH